MQIQSETTKNFCKFSKIELKENTLNVIYHVFHDKMIITATFTSTQTKKKKIDIYIYIIKFLVRATILFTY